MSPHFGWRPFTGIWTRANKTIDRGQAGAAPAPAPAPAPADELEGGDGGFEEATPEKSEALRLELLLLLHMFQGNLNVVSDTHKCPHRYCKPAHPLLLPEEDESLLSLLPALSALLKNIRSHSTFTELVPAYGTRGPCFSRCMEREHRGAACVCGASRRCGQ